jgi:hypothetical protein
MDLRAVKNTISEKPSKRSVEGLDVEDGLTLVQESEVSQSAGQQETMSANYASDLILSDVEETGIVENEYFQKTDVEDCSEELLGKRKPKETQMPKVPVNMKIKWRIGKESVIIENTNGCKKTDANDEVKSLNVDEPDQMVPITKLYKESEKSSDTRKVIACKEKNEEISVKIRSVYQNKKLPKTTAEDNTENTPNKPSNYQLDIRFIENVLNGLFEQTLYIFENAKGVKNVNKPYSIFTSFLDSNANDTEYSTIKYLGHSELRINENFEASGIQIIWEEFKFYSEEFEHNLKNLYNAVVAKGYGGTFEIFQWECFLIDRHHDIKIEDLVAIRHLILMLSKISTSPRKVFEMLFFLACDVKIFNCIFSVANFKMAIELSFKSLRMLDRIHHENHFQRELIKELYKFIDQCIEILTRLKNTKALKSKVKYEDLCEENPDQWLIEITKKMADFSPRDKEKKDCVGGRLKHLLKLFSIDLNEQNISESFKVQLENLLNVGNY